MTTWTKQMGHPVVTVQILNETTISLTQTHFLLDPSTKPTEVGVHNNLTLVIF
jgi:aminopeptidase N